MLFQDITCLKQIQRLEKLSLDSEQDSVRKELFMLLQKEGLDFFQFAFVVWCVFSFPNPLYLA